MRAHLLKHAGLSLFIPLLLLLGNRSRATMMQTPSNGSNNINDALLDTAYQNGDAGYFPFLPFMAH